jgi:F-type H+-transporting ATPase subunit alpha
VAGRLRLDLASYRALEAFAQFASELDDTTQQQLRRGQRLVATLNQPQYSPWPFEEQVVAIWAATNGYTDSIEVADVQRFHAELIDYLRAGGRVLDAIRESGELSDETEGELRSAVESFVESFQPTNQDGDEPQIGAGTRAAGDARTESNGSDGGAQAEATRDTGADADATEPEPTTAG